MKKNNKGFTLIEIIAVVVIIGIVMLIAVPAVSDYIVSSRKSSYISNIEAYMETARAEYEMKYYGSYLYEDEIMIVPIDVIKLEQGDGGSTPFGMYVADKNYIVIVPERNSFGYYANFVDSAGYGVTMLPSNSLSRDYIEKIDEDAIIPYSDYMPIDGASEPLMQFVFNEKTYSYCGDRESDNAPSGVDSKIIIVCTTE